MSRAFAWLAVPLALLLAGQAGAAPLDPALQQQLLGIYDSYNKAIAAGRLADAAALRGAVARAGLLAAAKKSKREQADMLAMARDMIPDGVTPQHSTLSADGSAATIVTLASKTITPAMAQRGAGKAGGALQGELTLTFAREGGAWKLADLTFGMDPARIKPCHDEAVEVIASYDATRQTDLGGQIRRVEFRPDHTLVVIRMLDEENCLILPPREKAEAAGLKTAMLVPYAMVEATALPHRTDGQRAWIDHITVTAE